MYHNAALREFFEKKFEEKQSILSGKSSTTKNNFTIEVLGDNGKLSFTQDNQGYGSSGPPSTTKVNFSNIEPDREEVSTKFRERSSSFSNKYRWVILPYFVLSANPIVIFVILSMILIKSKIMSIASAKIILTYWSNKSL